MQRCPDCHRFGVENDSCSGVERCIWSDCLWRNGVGDKWIDVDKVKHPIRFQKFIDSIKIKKGIAL